MATSFRLSGGNLPFMDPARLRSLFGADAATSFVAAYEAFVASVTARRAADGACETCTSPIVQVYYADCALAARIPMPEDQTVRATFVALCAVTPDPVKRFSKDAAILTESVLYRAVGKEDARSVLARFRRLERAAGMHDPWSELI